MGCLRSARRGGLLVGLAAMLLSSGCVQGPSDTLGPPPSMPPYDPATATGPAGDEGYVAYESGPPVEDVDAYPSVFYDDAPVYYIGGTWYRHDRRGWGVYPREPQGLARMRVERERDPRWVQPAPRRLEPAPRAAARGRQLAPENRPREVPRQGVTEWQGSPTRPQGAPLVTRPGQTVGAGHPVTAPAARPEVRTNVRPAPAPHGGAPGHGMPSGAPQQHR
jgi:hypothetical protein